MYECWISKEHEYINGFDGVRIKKLEIKSLLESTTLFIKWREINAGSKFIYGNRGVYGFEGRIDKEFTANHRLIFESELSSKE